MIFSDQITDFGLSTTRATSSQTSKGSKCGSGNPAGTLAYIAPERYDDQHDQSLIVQTKSDVYR